MLVEILGLIHSLTYIAARIGTIHQIALIWKSKQKNPPGFGLNTAQLSSNYRGSAALLFLSMILWGLSLDPIDWVVVSSRGLALLLFLFIVRELWLDRRCKIAQSWLIYCVSLTVIAAGIMILNWQWFKSLSSIFAVITVFFSFNLTWGAAHRVYKIIKARSPGKQSIVEMSFQLSKDLTGIIYGLLLGFDKMWPLVVTLFLTSFIRTINIAVYLYYSQNRFKQSNVSTQTIINRSKSLKRHSLSNQPVKVKK